MRTEVVLLTHNLAVRSTTIRRPPQHELLRACLLIFLKHELNTPQCLELIKQEADRLLSGLCCPPSRSRARHQRRLDRVCRLLGGEFDLCQPLQVEPAFVDSWWVDGWPLSIDKPPSTYDGGEGWGYDDNMRRFCMNRHGWGVTGVFLDGSARRVKLPDLWKLRWHKGYEPADVRVP